MPLSLLTSAIFLTHLAPTLAIINARIETGDGTVLDSGSILIAGDRVTDVGPGLSIPGGTTVIDAKGGTVYPGFIDAYSTRGLKIPDAPANGTPPDSRNTAPASMWHENRKGIRGDLKAADCLDLKGPFNDQWSQGITTVMLSPGSGTVAGSAAIVNLAAQPKVLVPQAATELSFRGGAGTGYPGTLFGVTSLLRQTLADAQRATTVPTKDPNLLGLGPVATGKVPALFNANTFREIVRANRIAEEFGLRMIVNGGGEASRESALLKAKGTPVILSLDLPDEPDRKPQTGANPTPTPVLEERWRLWKDKMGNAKRLNDAGIPFAVGGTGGFGKYLDGIRKLVANGLPRDAALRAMTSGGAGVLGIGDRVGTLAPGKIANLVIMDGDFASDKSTVTAIVVEGAQMEVKK